MFDIALFLFFIVMSYRVARSVRNAASIFAEFKQSQLVGLLALLFPLGPIVLFVGSIKFPISVAYVAAACCYFPCLLIVRQQSRALDTAGTDRVQRAQSALQQAFGTALVGLIFIAVHLVFAFAATSFKI